jgi:GNAT superfamily N-acetyltransferase
MIRVRPALARDAEGIARIYVEGWRDAYPGLVPDKVLLRLSVPAQAPGWTATIRHDGGRGLVQVATDETGRVIGFGSAGRARHASLPFAGEVFTLYVEADRRGLGAGGWLLGALFAALARAGRPSAVIWVLAGNPARHFYRAQGGRLVAEWTEELWGAKVPQAAYGWPDLARVVSAGTRGTPPG